MFKRIYFFYLTYLTAMVYSQTLMMLWFFQNGVSYTWMLFYFLAIYVPVLPLAFFFKGRKFKSRFSLWLGIVSSAGGVLIANFITNQTYFIFLIAFVFALNTLFFWVIYSAMHFKYSHNEEHGFKSGAFFFLSPILTAGTPATIVKGATFLLTTAPAPTIAPLPMVTPGRIIARGPIKT